MVSYQYSWPCLRIFTWRSRHKILRGALTLTNFVTVGDSDSEVSMAQNGENDSGVVPRSESTSGTGSTSGPWSGRIRIPDNLDLSTDRGESFHVWKESWEGYVLLTGLNNAQPEIQLAALKNVMTPDSRRILRNLELTPQQRADPSAVLTAIEKFAVGQVNEVIERKRFNERIQADGEVFDDFLTSLRELSRACNFCVTCNDSLIRDSIVMGLRSAETVKRFCAVSKLSLAETITVCRADEAAARDAAELRTEGRPRASACRVHIREPSRSSCERRCERDPSRTSRERRRERDPSWCDACGRRRHSVHQPCPARGQRCRNCQQLHHFSAVCPHPPAWRPGAPRGAELADRRGRWSEPPRGAEPADRWGRPPRGAESADRRGQRSGRARAQLHRGGSSPPAHSYWTEERRARGESSTPPRQWFRSPSPGYSPTRAQEYQRQQGQRVRFQSPDDDSDYSEGGGGQRPGTYAVIAATSVESAPRVRLDVTAHSTVSVRALPDTGADISVGGLDFLEELGEYPENLLPPEQHPSAANGEIIASVGVLPVTLTLGDITTPEEIHILPDVRGLLLSWRATRQLQIIPRCYPRQISCAQSSAAPARPDSTLSWSSQSAAEDQSPGLFVESLAGMDGEAATGSEGVRTPPTAPTPVPPTADRPTTGNNEETQTRRLSTKATTAPPGSPLGVQSTMPIGGSRVATAAPPGPPPIVNLPAQQATDPAVSHIGRTSAGNTATQKSSFPDITAEFPTVFDGRIRVMPGEYFKIHLKEDAVPFCATSPRRVALSLRQPLKEELLKLESEGIIVPVKEPTEWCAPIVVEPKKGGGIRLCVDLSRLNKFVRREHYQSPTPIEEVASIVASGHAPRAPADAGRDDAASGRVVQVVSHRRPHHPALRRGRGRNVYADGTCCAPWYPRGNIFTHSIDGIYIIVVHFEMKKLVAVGFR